MLKLGGWPRLTWGRDPRGRRPGRGPGRRTRWGAARAIRRRGPASRRQDSERVRHPPCPAPPAARSSYPPRRGRGGPMSTSVPPGARRGHGGDAASLGVTPRQACPRPGGLGRNLRSKTRWFAGFCNSHQVSHFATFFIDARAEISVAESRTVRGRRRRRHRRVHSLFPWRPPRRVRSAPPPDAARRGAPPRPSGPGSVPPRLATLGGGRARSGRPCLPTPTQRAHVFAGLSSSGSRQ